MDANLVQERMPASLLAWFGGFALLLAAVGLYGRLACAVVERTREIGIRLALGATRSVVLWTILRQVLVLVLTGVAIGLPLSMASASDADVAVRAAALRSIDAIHRCDGDCRTSSHLPLRNEAVAHRQKTPAKPKKNDTMSLLPSQIRQKED